MIQITSAVILDRKNNKKCFQIYLILEYITKHHNPAKQRSKKAQKRAPTKVKIKIRALIKKRIKAK